MMGDSSGAGRLRLLSMTARLTSGRLRCHQRSLLRQELPSHLQLQPQMTEKSLGQTLGRSSWKFSQATAKLPLSAQKMVQVMQQAPLRALRGAKTGTSGWTISLVIRISSQCAESWTEPNGLVWRVNNNSVQRPKI